MDRTAINTNAGELVRTLERFRVDQYPFAAAVALTRTAQDAQAEVRAGLPRRFTIRNRWVSQGIRIVPATKRRLESWVGSRDDFMALQETGGIKRPRGEHLAVPTEKVRRRKRGLISKAQRPRRVLQKPKVFLCSQPGVPSSPSANQSSALRCSTD